MPDDPIESSRPGSDDESTLRVPATEEDAVGDTGVTASPAEMPAVVIGRYRLIKELGKGGFGSVWQAEQTEPIRREVALKIIKPGMDSREIIARFEAERQALALMDHPNIAAVLDAGTTDRGQPYFVMELVKGMPITEYCDAHQLGIRERIELFIPVCQAVQHAHQKAILHRDLKPSNILVTEVDGKPVPKVIDFGIAKALNATREEMLQASLSLTREGMVVGTPQYMSPEQAGSRPDVDTRSDVYTLGVILHELLTGATPLSREELRQGAWDEMLRLIRDGEIKRPSSRLMPVTEAVALLARERNTEPKKLGHALRGDLDWILLKTLEKDRARRYETANAFAQDLRSHLQDEPVSAGPPSASYRLRKLVRRNRAAFATAAIIVLLLAAGIAASTWQAVRATRAESLAKARLQEVAAQKQLADEEKAKALTAQHDAVTAKQEADAKNAALIAAQNETETKNTALNLATTEHLRLLHEASLADYAEGGPQGPNWEQRIPYLTRALKWEPTNALAAMSLYSTITFHPPNETHFLLHVLPHDDYVSSAEFSPDGSRVVTASQDGTARVWDAATGRQIGEPMRHEHAVVHVNFSSDGKRILTISMSSPYLGNDDPKIVRIWDAATGKSLGEPMREENGVWSDASFSPDGTRIITVNGNNTAQVWDAATGKPIGEPMLHKDRVECAEFSPDGSRIVTGTSDEPGESGEARIWDASTGKPLGKPIQNNGGVISASFSPDGKCILTGSRVAQIWDAATGKPMGKPMQDPNYKGRAKALFSPDGTRILTYLGRAIIRIWDESTGNEVCEIEGGEIHEVTFSPDGRQIAVAADVGTSVYDAETGQALGEDMVQDRTASFSPDGARIVTAGGKTARVWDARGNIPMGEPLRDEDLITSANFSPDGKLVVMATGDRNRQGQPGLGTYSGDVRIWDTATGKQVGEPMQHRSGVWSANFGPDGTCILTTSGDAAQVWDGATRKPLLYLKIDDDSVYGPKAVFSPDGKSILTVGGDEVQMLSSSTGLQFREPMRPNYGAVSANFSSDGKRIIITSGKDAQVWDTATGKQIGETSKIVNLRSANLSPDGARIITVGATGVKYSPDGGRVVDLGPQGIQMWDVASSMPLGEPITYNGGICNAVFSPDGRWIIANADGAFSFWDAKTGMQVGESMRDSLTRQPEVPQGRQSPDIRCADGRQVSSIHFNCASFSPDGTRILTSEWDTARLWEVKSLLNLPAETPPWVNDWASAVAGFKFDANDVVQPIPEEDRLKILSMPHDGDDPWSKIARWLATPPAQRTIHPDSPHTYREIAERERDFGSHESPESALHWDALGLSSKPPLPYSNESLESALRWDPTVPLVRLLLARYEENPQRAAFLRDYDLKRLPDDPTLWARAVQSLHEQKDDIRARIALDKLATLAPDQASALKTQLGL